MTAVDEQLSMMDEGAAHRAWRMIADSQEFKKWRSSYPGQNQLVNEIFGIMEDYFIRGFMKGAKFERNRCSHVFSSVIVQR
jgi:hypothetical protein